MRSKEELTAEFNKLGDKIIKLSLQKNSIESEIHELILGIRSLQLEFVPEVKEDPSK